MNSKINNNFYSVLTDCHLLTAALHSPRHIAPRPTSHLFTADLHEKRQRCCGGGVLCPRYPLEGAKSIHVRARRRKAKQCRGRRHLAAAAAAQLHRRSDVTGPQLRGR